MAFPRNAERGWGRNYLESCKNLYLELCRPALTSLPLTRGAVCCGRLSIDVKTSHWCLFCTILQFVSASVLAQYCSATTRFRTVVARPSVRPSVQPQHDLPTTETMLCPGSSSGTMEDILAFATVPRTPCCPTSRSPPFAGDCD